METVTVMVGNGERWGNEGITVQFLNGNGLNIYGTHK